MATLKGHNFRIGILSTSPHEYSVFGYSTSCTITLGTQTDDGTTKDEVGMSAKPVITSKNWSVMVDSLTVVDAAAILTAIKNREEFVLVWDETSTVDNQTPQSATFRRSGRAFLNDLTLTFNDRENSAKNLQFTGNGPLSTPSYSEDMAILPADEGYTKGQFVRLFLGSDNTATPSKVIAAAKQLSLHVSLSLEDATTKDTEGDWQMQEVTGLSYDISTNALVRSGDNITSSVQAQGLNELETIYEGSQPVKFQIANVSGANQRTKGTVIVSGSVIISQLSIQAQNRQNATYDATLTGYGDYTVGA